MEFFRFCLEIIRREAKRFNVGIKPETAGQLTAANADDINYDNANNRCAFLYRCGTINLSFAKDCFSKFLSDYNGMEYLITKWKSGSCLTFCSLTKGPALDYIALLLSHEQCRVLTSLIGNIRIITKYGAWRNSANILLETINEGYFKNLPPSIGKIEVTQGDPFNNFNEKVRLPISDSDIVMMIKTLNLQSDGYDQMKISKTIKELIEALKPGAILFCIDTKPSIKEFTQLLTVFPGKYLLQPTNMNTKIDLEYTELYKDHFGCLPVVSGRGCFFVWEKSSFSALSMKSELSELTESLKQTLNLTDKKYDKVSTEGTSLEFLGKATLSKESEYCDQDLRSRFNSSNTSKLDTEASAINTFELGRNGLLEDKVNSLSQKSSSLLSDSSRNESVSRSDHLVKKEKLDACLSSVKSYIDSVSTSIHMQTEPEEFDRRIEVARVIELTNKITDLTEELTKLLENNTLKGCPSDNCIRSPAEMCNPPDKKVDCLRSRFLPCSQNFSLCCCTQKCACHESDLSSNCDSKNVSVCDEISNYSRRSIPAESNTLVQNASPSTAQLVIPLNNLPPSVISQIVSLITPSNHE